MAGILLLAVAWCGASVALCLLVAAAIGIADSRGRPRSVGADGHPLEDAPGPVSLVAEPPPAG